MKRRELLSLAASGLALAALLSLCFWLGSLDFGDFRPENPTVTFVLWALSTCVVIGTITLGFLLFRNLVKLYVQRRQNKLGSRIQSKLVTGVLAISIAPIALHVVYSVFLLNRNLDKWFSQPTVEVLKSAERFMDHATDELLSGLRLSAERLASAPEIESAMRTSVSGGLERVFEAEAVDYVAFVPTDGQTAVIEQSRGRDSVPQGFLEKARPREGALSHGLTEGWLYATAALESGMGWLVVASAVPAPILREQSFMEAQVHEWQQLEAARPVVWRTYAYILALITIFMAFIAVWLAHFASRQITRPIEALVTATGELAGGHLDYRVQTHATDELAGLVASFNSMSRALEGKTQQLRRSNRDLANANAELEERRRFINAILESITPAVVSVDESRHIVKFNESARQLPTERPISEMRDVTEFLQETDRSAFRRMFSTARRTGFATREFALERNGRPVNLAVAVSSLDSGGQQRHGFVVVLEDTTEIYRAQRSEAWREVARKLAHEIKNPLTPVALAAGSIDRLLSRLDRENDESERSHIRAKLDQLTRIIKSEVRSLKSLVNSLSDLARFPAVRPERTDLNSVVRDAVSVFEGRLPGVRLCVDTDPEIPLAKIDPEPFKRALINLIDNAAEVVQERWVKEIVVTTRSRFGGTAVELTVADSGPGISPENRERLFVPYFSTKKRGTGLGLSIVRRIVQDHRGTIRVEDNHPTGSRFVIEVPAASQDALALREATG